MKNNALPADLFMRSKNFIAAPIAPAAFGLRRAHEVYGIPTDSEYWSEDFMSRDRMFGIE